ncbi:MAG: MATE family efflux transporter, partial [Erysipelotrichia bacterium]|nr:MATE family efflux transporter [Erysipelotrichia bacterium]
RYYLGITSGIITGAMFVAAYTYGTGKQKELRISMETSVIICLMFAVLSTVLYVLFAKDALRLFQVPESLLDASAHYLQLYSLGFIPYFIFQLCIGLLRAIGETARPTRYLILSFLLNIAFDYILTGIFNLGSVGIAIAFVLAQSVSLLITLKNMGDLLSPNFLHLNFCFNTCARILKIGIPSSLISIAYAATNILIQSSINLLGSETISSYAIYLKLDNFYWIILACLGTAMTAFSGQCYGAGKYHRISSSIRHGILIGYLITACIALLFKFAGTPLVSLFTSDQSTISTAVSILSFMAPCYFAYPCIEIMTQVLKCIGKSVPATIITLLFCCGFRIVWIVGYALHHLSYQSVMLCYPLSWTITSLVFIIYYEIVGRRLLNERHSGIIRPDTRETAD